MAKAWTIVELLVVIAIIAIVVSLMLGPMLRARVEAQRVACRIVVKSYGLRYTERGRLVIEIPSTANCHDCHKPRYEAWKVTRP